jgi:acyl carrier protein
MSVAVEQILEIVEQSNIVEDVKALDLDRPLRDQGVDSLDFSGVLFNIDEMFDIEIPDEDIDQLLTINDIVSYVNSKKA